MKRRTKYVGLDVHQAMTVASVREEGGRVIARTAVATEETALLEFFTGMRGSVHVALEEGTQAQWLHDLLVPVVDRVVVCDRRGASRHGNKGDQVDADHLSELLRRGGLRAVYHGSADRVTLKEFTRTYQNVVEDSTRAMLRLKALFRARGIKTPGQGRVPPEAAGLVACQAVGTRGPVPGRGVVHPTRRAPGSCGRRRSPSWWPKRDGTRRGRYCGASPSWGRCGASR